MSKNKKTAPEPVKVRYSLARKLSSRLFFRLLGIFLSLDIMICLITGVFLIGYGERKADAAARMLKDSLLPTPRRQCSKRYREFVWKPFRPCRTE
jgi:hypothetical protein